ncbi:lysoplasmalogenase [uncultured Clostridium sp.]|uniref:lysoplasmalogenase n=1 Tax=uncultured Clostridium sp. TaxID=59620 RepID=UPI0028F0DF5E|nr:lysoplasmalogenase [uncultured Clostridium sp.]
MKLFVFSVIALQIVIFTFVAHRLRKGGTRYGNDVSLPLNIKVTLSISCIVLAAAIFFFNSGTYYPYSKYVFFGMVISFFGDLAMAEVLGFKNRLIGGMSIFALSQMLYTVGFVKIITYNKVFNDRYIFIYITVLIIFIALCLKFLKPKFKGEKGELIFGISYASLILTMGIWAALLVYSFKGGLFLTLIGAIVFVISDSLIALAEFFHLKIPYGGFLIWVTYVMAQVCIICSPIFS